MKKLLFILLVCFSCSGEMSDTVDRSGTNHEVFN